MKLLRQAHIPLKILEQQGRQIADQVIGAGAVFAVSREYVFCRDNLLARACSNLCDPDGACADAVLATTMRLRALPGRET